VTLFLEKEDLETFAAYGFSIDYPSACWIELNKRSNRESGDVFFHFPDNDKIFLSWRDLKKAKKKFQTVEEQAEQGVKKIRKSSSVKTFERVVQDTLELNSHRAAYNHFRLGEVVRFFSGREPVGREGFSLHLRCENSARYFVIYTVLSSSAPENFEDLFKAMMNSLRCH